MNKKLSELMVGDRARVVDILAHERLRQRLIELGLQPGVEIEVTQKWSSLLIVGFERALIALRLEEASAALVEAL